MYGKYHNSVAKLLCTTRISHAGIYPIALVVRVLWLRAIFHFSDRRLPEVQTVPVQASSLAAFKQAPLYQ